MISSHSNSPMAYQEGAMAKPVCLICGEHLGNHIYLGKCICSGCLEFIRSNY